jgi:hypothetical protein
MNSDAKSDHHGGFWKVTHQTVGVLSFCFGGGDWLTVSAYYQNRTPLALYTYRFCIFTCSPLWSGDFRGKILESSRKQNLTISNNTVNPYE